MLFGNKKALGSEEYEKVLKKIAGLEAQVLQMSAKFDALNTSYNDLRGKFNRKLNILRDQEQEDLESEKFNKPFTPFM